MAALGLGVAGGTLPGGAWVDGLKVAAVAVVAHAVWSMARALAPDLPRAGLALGVAALSLLVATPFSQLAFIALGAVAGIVLLPPLGVRPTTAQPGSDSGESPAVSRGVAAAALALFAVLLVGLPLLRAATADPAVAFVDAFYRAGALVFGGGHVVLPLLEASVVAPGWVSQDAFLAGYGAAQALPGRAPRLWRAAVLARPAGPPGRPRGARGGERRGVRDPGGGLRRSRRARRDRRAGRRVRGGRGVRCPPHRPRAAACRGRGLGGRDGGRPKRRRLTGPAAARA
jgi:chromate transporter